MKRNKTIIIFCLFTIIFMGALSFAAVPLYDLFCRVTGYSGVPNIINVVSEEQGQREFIIRYDVNISDDLDWKVTPEKLSDKVITGDNQFTYYLAKNMTSNISNGIATYNIIPAEAAEYFLKVECFCFSGQELKPGEELKMPLTYFIDPAIDRYKELNNVDTITISYTLFKNKELL